MTSGTRIIANAIASSPIPKTAPPSENSTNITGMRSASAPAVRWITAMIPASMAPVRSTIPKAPPMIRMNATTPMAAPHLLPETSPSNA